MSDLELDSGLYNILNIVLDSMRNSSGHTTLNNIEVMPLHLTL